MIRRDRSGGFIFHGCVLALATSLSSVLGCGVVQSLGERADGGRACVGETFIGVADAGTESDTGCAEIHSGFSPGGETVVFADASNGKVVPGVDGGGSSGFATDDAGKVGEPSVSPADCKDSCSSAAVLGCNVDGFVADDECETLCANSLTQSELDCVSNAPCATLLKALAAETSFCGIQIHDEPVSATACTSDCSDLVTACNPSFYVGNTCQDLCANTPTMTQMACLQTMSCSSLSAALVAGHGFCGFPAFSDGGSP